MDPVNYLPIVTNSMKWWLSILLGVLFFLLASPWAFKVTDSLTGLAPGGVPTTAAVVIHAVIFAVILRLFMW